MGNSGNRVAALDTGAEQQGFSEGIDPVVAEAMKRFRRCSEWEATARQNFIEDIKFAEGDATNGYQWPAAVKRNRDVDKRPCLTMNVIKQHNKQIINDQMKNKAAIKIRAVGGGATVDSANLIAAIIRDIEYRSNAQSAYKMGSKFQVDGGIGWWRLCTQYEDNESFNQEIRILRIKDPLSVYMDPDCQQEDCSDAKFAFVFDLVPREKFFEMYPEFEGQVSLQPLSVDTGDDDWVTKDYVRVAEYFRKVFVKDELLSFIDPKDGMRKSLLKSKMPGEVYDGLVKSPFTKSRAVDIPSIEWKLIVGSEIADETEWPSKKYIPLVRVLGEEVIIEGVMDRKGQTRTMTDAQRMYNYNSPLALSTPLPTPYGWTTMGEVQANDELLNEHGEIVKVLGTSPVFIGRKCYEVVFDGKTKIIADEKHLWTVEERGKRIAGGFKWIDRTVTTAELDPEKHFICSTAPLKLEEDKNLLIHPYVLGAWLGDGSAASARMSAHADDVEETRAHIASLGYSIGEAYGFSAESKGVTFNINGIRDKLRDMGLKDDKFIPMQYLRASENQRWALLQGLMDTDGHITPNHQCVFINTNRNLIAGFLELLRTLGIKPSIQKITGITRNFPNGRRYETSDSFRISFSADPYDKVFRLSRKQQVQAEPRKTHWRRTKRVGIVSVTPVESVPVKCVSVESETHLFLAGWGMTPTHNSAQVEFVALQSKTPYIATAKAIEDYEVMWNTANQVNHSVLVYNAFDPDHPDKPLPPPQRQQPPTSAPGFQEGMATAFQQMMMTSGQWQNAMGMQGNERTGSAIRERQHQADNSVYNFQDSYEDAIRATGKQILDLIPSVYDTKRLMRLQLEDGEEFDLEIDPGNQQALQEYMNQQGEIVKRVLNPKLGQYDVQADVGKAFGTRREESKEALTLVLTQAPALTGLIGDLLLRSMDFAEAQEAAMRLRRMVPAQALGKGPTPAEQQLQAKLTASQQALAKALQELGKKDLKLAGKDQARYIDVYEAHTERVKALAELIPDDPKLLRDLLMELDNDTLGETLRPIISATAQRLEEQSADGEPGSSASLIDGADEPPVQGARRAPDGEWYLQDPTRKGKYLRVGPMAEQHGR